MPHFLQPPPARRDAGRRRPRPSLARTGTSTLLAGLAGLALAASSPAATVTGANAGETLRGSAGVDLINGQGGRDTLYGEAGSDSLYGDTGPDTIFGQDGDDTIDGGSADDTLSGAAGNDALAGGFGHDVLRGGFGVDTVNGGAAPDTLFGDEGDDVLTGESAADVLWGGSENDQLSGGTGADTLRGGEGDDTLYANEGGADAVLDCGPGNDTLYIDPYRKPGGISDAQIVREGRATDCETVVELAPELDPTKGSTWQAEAFSDASRTGTGRNDTLLGGHGSNRVMGEGGDDVLWGDARHDSGGARAKRQTDYVNAGAGNDTVYAGRGSNTILGLDGNDYLQGNGLRNVIRGGNGSDTIRANSAVMTRIDAGADADLVTAIVSSGRVTVDCGPGEDTLQISKYRGNATRVTHRNCENVKRG